VPSILADIYWSGSLLPEILFTQSTAVLHKYWNDKLKIQYLHLFIVNCTYVYQNPLAMVVDISRWGTACSTYGNPNCLSVQLTGQPAYPVLPGKWPLKLYVHVPMGISLQPYCTYVHAKFQLQIYCTSLDIVCQKKALVIITEPPSQPRERMWTRVQCKVGLVQHYNRLRSDIITFIGAVQY